MKVDSVLTVRVSGCARNALRSCIDGFGGSLMQRHGRQNKTNFYQLFSSIRMLRTSAPHAPVDVTGSFYRLKKWSELGQVNRNELGVVVIV